MATRLGFAVLALLVLASLPQDSEAGLIRTCFDTLATCNALINSVPSLPGLSSLPALPGVPVSLSACQNFCALKGATGGICTANDCSLTLGLLTGASCTCN
ncbi:uncharacterized protein LOC131946721 [Physella acuta]|uniref:uncharacterized protein LOC131946721 n=1 Tax=Physella acuta TaxID=109671 RepID=UPI0027DEA609|nr:uncharacterized protein LOC131946721 [Physella acuta]